MQSQFTDKAQNALAQAGRCARGLKQGYIGTEHILVGLLKEDTGVAAKVLADNGVEVDQVMEMIRDLIAFENGVAVKDKEGYSPRAARILEEAHRQAARFGQKQTGTEHLLLALIKEGENVAVRLLNTLGANVQKIYVDTLIAIGQDGNLYKEDLGKKGDRKAKQSTLEQYSRDLTALAREGKLDPVVGREEEIRRVVQILSRRTKNNPCLVGEPGVGKTAVVEGLAARIVAGDVPFTVQNKRVLTLDLSGMVAGSKYRGEFEERIKKVLKEVTEDGNIILFLDELHTIIGAGGAEGAIDASNIMKPSLARGEIQLIGATTIAEYRKYIEKDAALERRFQPVTVEEPTEEEAVRILEGIKGKYEDHHHVQITPEAIEAAVRLSSRYINDRNLPDKAIDLIDEASASARLSALDAPDKAKEIADRIHEMDQEMERAIRMEAFDQMAEIKKQQDALVKKYDRLMKKREKQEAGNVISIGENEIAEVVAQWTKIPVQKLAEKESERLLKLEKTLHKRVIGQEEAVTAAVEDVLTIVNLKRGWQYITTQNSPLTLTMEKQINKIVAAEDALVPGELRQGKGGVNLGSEDFFEPPLINEKQEQSFLQKILADPQMTTTDKALTVMYHNMRQQIFWDGNKRTATLSANKIMIDGGAGLINIPLDKWDQWNELIANYYRTNDMTKVKKWTYDNGIQGLQIRANKELSANELNQMYKQLKKRMN